jgi:hypothetical protein
MHSRMNETSRQLSVHASHCANCGTPLQGEWCHHCGQAAHSVLRHLPELLEDAAELLFHFNGRIMNTLPALYLFPGRLTREYLAGRRVRYVAPFRLMFVLCLMSFFFLHVNLRLNVHGDDGTHGGLFAQARTATEVLQRLDGERASIDTATTADTPRVPGLDVVLNTPRDALDAAALDRLAALLPDHAPTAMQWQRIDALARNSLARAASADALRQRLDTALALAEAVPADSLHRAQRRQQLLQQAGKRLAALASERGATTPAHDDGASGSFLQRHIQRLKQNVVRLRDGGDARDQVVNHVFSALPQSMLVLVPVFALILQLLYLFRHQLYMQHLIVALHSHAFLFLSLLLLTGLDALHGVLPGWAAPATGWLTTAVWLWVPVYLLLMQKRVYGQGWTITLIKYLATGFIYLILLLFTLAAAMLVGLAG